MTNNENECQCVRIICLFFLSYIPDIKTWYARTFNYNCASELVSHNLKHKGDGGDVVRPGRKQNKNI